MQEGIRYPKIPLVFDPFDRYSTSGCGPAVGVTMSDIGELDRLLAENLDALLALPADSFAARHALLKQRDELSAQAARFRFGDSSALSSRELLAALGAIRSSLKHLAKTDPLTPAPAIAATAPGLARVKTDRSSLTDHLHRIEAELRRRGIDPDRRRQPTR